MEKENNLYEQIRVLKKNPALAGFFVCKGKILTGKS